LNITENQGVLIGFSEACGNLTGAVGNTQINSTGVIGADGRVDVEHVKRYGTLLTGNADRQIACREHKPPSF
jgi:hypothetical protein